MKKLLAILFLSITITGCNKKFNSDGMVSSDEVTFKIMRVGQCQYLFRDYDRGCMFTHSGECDNPRHQPLIMYSDTTLFNASDTALFDNPDTLK